MWWRSDVSTMKNIIKLFREWQRHYPHHTVADYAACFLDQRYNLPGFDREQSLLQRQVAFLALPFYSQELNADQSPSLLAILGAVSEAERFLVDPGLVFRKALGWRHRDLYGPLLGGAGIADLSEALQKAERRFKEYLASMERAEMGLA